MIPDLYRLVLARGEEFILVYLDDASDNILVSGGASEVSFSDEDTVVNLSLLSLDHGLAKIWLISIN